MPPAKTEERRDNAKGLDVMRPELALRLLAAGQQEAARSVEQAIEPISAAARLAADSLASGGRLAYAGAGSSGLMALADALELPGTYGIAREQIVILIAGGAESLTDLAGGYEDDMELARADVRNAGIGAGDCLISVSASGSTPYAIAAADEAGQRGARVIGMANNAGAPLLLNADVSILLETPPEVVSGSTRMGAGTAQKIAFNMLSTMVGIHLGHVLDGLGHNRHRRRRGGQASRPCRRVGQAGDPARIRSEGHRPCRRRARARRSEFAPGDRHRRGVRDKLGIQNRATRA